MLRNFARKLAVGFYVHTGYMAQLSDSAQCQMHEVNKSLRQPSPRCDNIFPNYIAGEIVLTDLLSDWHVQTVIKIHILYHGLSIIFQCQNITFLTAAAVASQHRKNVICRPKLEQLVTRSYQFFSYKGSFHCVALCRCVMALDLTLTLLIQEIWFVFMVVGCFPPDLWHWRNLFHLKGEFFCFSR